MDWFEAITGFKETTYAETVRRLVLRDGHLVGAGGTAWSVGELETPSLAELRLRAAPLARGQGRTQVRCLAADVRALHRAAEARGALFQVASQFNLLEMVGPDITPEHGVTRYRQDPTQGPACAMAAGAATIYRNYLTPLARRDAQRVVDQIDCLADLGRALAPQGPPPWSMRNGYALCHPQGLEAIEQRLAASAEAQRDGLRSLLRIGLQWDVDVTDLPRPGHRVTQAFCSALPVAYSRIPASRWRHFATLVLEATYEATLLGAMLNAQRTGNRRVLLTRVGGGAFGNSAEWIASALRRALHLAPDAGLEVCLVSHGEVPEEMREIEREFAGRP